MFGGAFIRSVLSPCTSENAGEGRRATGEIAMNELRAMHTVFQAATSSELALSPVPRLPSPVTK